jgi:hypothetical protein
VLTLGSLPFCSVVSPQCKIHHVTPVKLNLLNKCLPHHEWQLLYEVGTNTTDPRIIFAKYIPQLNNAAADKVCEAADMTTNKQLQLLKCLSEAKTETTTWSLHHTKRASAQLKREIYAITINERRQFQIEFSICMMEFDVSQKIHHSGAPENH